jgi:hypothetical protein
LCVSCFDSIQSIIGKTSLGYFKYTCCNLRLHIRMIKGNTGFLKEVGCKQYDKCWYA